MPKQTYGMWGIDETTKLRFRLICVSKGVTARELLKEIVDNLWETDEIVPSKSGERLIKRIVKRAVNRRY